MSQIGITWKRVEGEVGHEPIKENLKIVCQNCCIWAVQRTSIIWPTMNGKPDVGINDVGWKCQRCGFYFRFMIEDTTEYIQEILERRNGDNWWCPPLKEWKENDEIARQLEGLNYQGGR